MSVALLANAAGFNAGMASATTTMKAFTVKVGALGVKVAAAGKAMTLGLTLPIVAMGALSVIAFDKQAKALAQVEQGIISTGAAAGFTIDELARIASGLQEITIFGDEEILTGVTAQLLTFSNLVGPQFEAAQVTVMDLATRLGTDLKSAAIQVGKALNDPITGLSMLSRSGITFTEKQTDVIKSLWNTGKQAEAQNVILKELARQYGGSAEAAVAGAGKIKQLKNVIGDLSEEFGSIIMEGLTPFVEKLKVMVDAIREMSPEEKEKIIKYMAALALAGPAAIAVGTLAKAVSSLVLATTALTGSAAGKALISVFGSLSAAIAAATVAALGAYAAFEGGKAIVKGIEGGLNQLGEQAEEVALQLDAIYLTGHPTATALELLNNRVSLLTDSFDNMVTAGIMTADQATAIKTEIVALYDQVKDVPDLAQVLSSHNWDVAIANILMRWVEDVPELFRLIGSISTAVVESSDEVIKAVEEVQKAWDTFDLDEANAEYDKLLEKWNDTEVGGLDHINVISDMEKEYKILIQAEKDIVAQGGAVDEELQELIAKYEKYVDIVEDAVPATESFSKALADLASSGAYTAKQALDSVVGAVENAYSTFFDAMSAMKETNETALEDYKTALQDLADAEGEANKDASDSRATALRELSNDLEDEKITREQYGIEKAQIEADYATAVETAAQRRRVAGDAEEYAYRQQQVGIQDILSDMLHDFLVAARQQLQLEAAKETVISIASGFALNFAAMGAHALAAASYLAGAGALAIAGFAQGGVVPGPPGAPVMAVVHGGEEIRTPAQQMVDYEMMGQAVRAGAYEALVEVLSKDAGRPIIVQLGDGTRLARALYDPLQAELARRGG